MVILSVLASCMDAFLFGVSFGLNKISITRTTALFTSFFPFLFSLISMRIGSIVNMGTEDAVSKGISVCIYLLLALYMSKNHTKKEYKEGIWIDQNKDFRISGKEIVLLSLSLSLDTWIIALPLGFSDRSSIGVALLFGAFNFILLFLGNKFSEAIRDKIPCQLMSFSWVIFIVLAFLHS